jgi:hypothetical protein
VDDINAAEYAGQVLGLSASRVRLAQEGKSAIDQRDEALVQRRHVLLDRFAQAVIHERDDDRAEALEAIQKWNTLHPNRVIAGMHLQHAVRMRMKHLAQAKQGIYLPPKRGLDARAYGDFADGE